MVAGLTHSNTTADLSAASSSPPPWSLPQPWQQGYSSHRSRNTPSYGPKPEPHCSTSKTSNLSTHNSPTAQPDPKPAHSNTSGHCPCRDSSTSSGPSSPSSPSWWPNAYAPPQQRSWASSSV